MEDIVTNGKVLGSVGQRLLQAGFKVNALRTLSTLKKDEWKQYDTTVVEAVRSRLVGVADLMSRNLVYSFPNGLGKTVLEYEDMSDISDAEVSMDGASRGKNDRVEFDLKYLPLPIIHKGFKLSIRNLQASRNGNMPLDTTMAGLAARKVAETLEGMYFNGYNSFAYGGGTIRGLLDADNRNTGSLTIAWDDSAATGEQILDDVRKMKQASLDDGHYGPWILYIPTEYETKLDDDFKADSDKTIRQRILEIAGIQDVKVADKLTAGNVVLVQMTSDVVRLVDGLPVNTVEWDAEGGMVFNFKVLCIQVPQIRADQNGKSGVVHYSEPT